MAKVFRFCGFETAMVTNKSVFQLIQDYKPDMLFLDDEVGTDRAVVEYPEVLFINESVKPAADIFNFPDIPSKPYHNSDVLYVGDNHPILRKLISSDINLKVFSNNRFLSVQHIGLANERLKPFYQNTKVCVATEEKYVYNCIFNKVKCVTNIKLDNDLDKYVCYIENEDDLMTALTPNATDETYIVQGYQCLIDNHTYFHRVMDLFNKLGLVQESHIVKCRLDSLKC